MPRAMRTGAVPTHPHRIAFTGQAGEGFGVAQGGWIRREGGIARASVTVLWRASAVTPAGRARGRLAAPTPQARPASAPRLSSPPWYGRRSRQGAVPARLLSQGRCPSGLGVFVSLGGRGEGGPGQTLAPCLGTFTAWCHSFGYTRVSGLCGGSSEGSWGFLWGSEWGIMPRGVGMRRKLIPADSAVPQRTGRSQRSLRGLQAPLP